MRQHVTPEQHDQLSPQAKERLRQWATSLPLSIGQCIQFLDEHRSANWSLYRWKDNKKCWELDLNKPAQDERELIDALWAAVLTILESEQKEEDA